MRTSSTSGRLPRSAKPVNVALGCGTPRRKPMRSAPATRRRIKSAPARRPAWRPAPTAFQASAPIRPAAGIRRAMRATSTSKCPSRSAGWWAALRVTSTSRVRKKVTGKLATRFSVTPEARAAPLVFDRVPRAHAGSAQLDEHRGASTPSLCSCSRPAACRR